MNTMHKCNACGEAPRDCICGQLNSIPRKPLIGYKGFKRIAKNPFLYDHFGVCYECRAGNHDDCIGVPCDCDCDGPHTITFA